ncbi:PQ loop repeat-domain-containing protein, partial [Cantharellus anzutake]|uniref:PQ loop repeat-domain-containing protein n=1 Tax=Cantharellus anzutake TaxID=1750568 RepID=UPI00190624EF
SEFLGYCSIGAWIGAQFPQLIHNAKLQSVEHLALPFLINWLFGEPMEAPFLSGCILTHQLPFQIYVATYFCFVDICLFTQFIYYSQRRFKKAQTSRYSTLIYPSSPIDTVSAHSRMRVRSQTYPVVPDQRSALSTRRSTTRKSATLWGWQTTQISVGYSGTANHSEPSTPEPVIGRIFAWTCTTLYLTSRLPQIWKNFARKSVEGLMMSLFVCAFFGNFFYVASITTNPKLDEPPPISRAFLRESVPYLLGSGGTLLFDVIIVAQSFIY